MESLRLVEWVARRRRSVTFLWILALSAACGPPAPPEITVGVGAGRGHHALEGRATWYGPGLHGRRTASGERFDMEALTAAHKSLPFGTRLRVTRTDTGRSVVVRVNDRGPFGDGIIDLSRAAGRQLGMLKRGRVPVKLTVLRWGG